MIGSLVSIANEEEDDDDCEDLFCFSTPSVGAILVIPAAFFIVGGLVMVARGAQLRSRGRRQRELQVGLGLTSAHLRLSF
jgi:hypothetical protein